MSTYRIHPEKTIWQSIDDGAVLINTDSSAYFSLNPTGSAIFALLADGPRRIDDLARWMQGRYGIAPDVAIREAGALLDALTREHLTVRVDDEAAIALTTGTGAASVAYEPPTLTRHGELEKLILSGE